jgi:hypothetical protein
LFSGQRRTRLRSFARCWELHRHRQSVYSSASLSILESNWIQHIQTKQQITKVTSREHTLSDTLYFLLDSLQKKVNNLFSQSFNQQLLTSLGESVTWLRVSLWRFDT